MVSNSSSLGYGDLDAFDVKASLSHHTRQYTFSAPALVHLSGGVPPGTF